MQKYAAQLRFCRSRHWLQEQAIWLRLYSCDTRPGSIESILDRIVAKGYNIVYLEVFADGQVTHNGFDKDTSVNAKDPFRGRFFL